MMLNMRKMESVKIVNILNKVMQYVKQVTISEDTGHDWWHIKRVYDLSIRINERERKNDFIVKMIALLHDLYDDKISDKNTKEALIKLMHDLEVYDDIIPEDRENIINAIVNFGYKGGFNEVEISEEGRIVQDADRIDAIGAIGIARVFTYGGKKGLSIFNPEQGIIKLKNEEEYRKLKRHSINHFYEKLLKIKDTMNTIEGREIAEKRTKFMEEFLEQFYREWYSQETYRIKGLEEERSMQLGTHLK